MRGSEPSRKREARATSVVAGGNQEVREGVWPAVESEGWPDVRWWTPADSGLYPENNENSSTGITARAKPAACCLPAVWRKDRREIRTYRKKTRGDKVS